MTTFGPLRPTAEKIGSFFPPHPHYSLKPLPSGFTHLDRKNCLKNHRGKSSSRKNYLKRHYQSNWALDHSVFRIRIK